MRVLWMAMRCISASRAELQVNSVWVPLAGGAGVEYSRGARNVYAGPRRGTDLEASATRNHGPARGSRCHLPAKPGVRRVRRDDLRCGRNHIAILALAAQ